MCFATSVNNSIEPAPTIRSALTGATKRPLIQTPWGNFPAGSLVVDSREREPTIVQGADYQEFLDYEGTEGEKFSLDALVVLQDGQWVTAERKAFEDYKQSWMSGKLERQCAAVDLLIVEDPDPMDMLDESKVHDNAVAHLDILNAAMWVKQTCGPSHTMAYLRRLANRKDGLTIRQNQLKNRSPRLRTRILEALPGINPHADVGDFTKGHYLEEGISWEQMADAIITAIDYYNEAKPDGERAIGPATKRRIEHALLEGETHDY